MIIDPFLNNPKTLYYKKFIMSNLQNTEILENLYEQELEWFMNNRPKNCTLAQLKSTARYYARKRFEELPEPGDYDD